MSIDYSAVYKATKVPYYSYFTLAVPICWIWFATECMKNIPNPTLTAVLFIASLVLTAIAKKVLYSSFTKNKELTTKTITARLPAHRIDRLEFLNSLIDENRNPNIFDLTATTLGWICTGIVALSSLILGLGSQQVSFEVTLAGATQGTRKSSAFQQVSADWQEQIKMVSTVTIVLICCFSIVVVVSLIGYFNKQRVIAAALRDLQHEELRENIGK